MTPTRAVRMVRGNKSASRVLKSTASPASSFGRLALVRASTSSSAFGACPRCLLRPPAMASTDCRKPQQHQLLTWLASHVINKWGHQAFRCNERSCNA